MSLMKIRGITGAELSRACKLGNAKYYQWKAGKQEPSTKSLLKVASYLETTVEYLTGQTDKKEKSTPVSESGLDPEINEIFTMLKNASLEDRCKARDMVALLLGQNPKNP